MDVYECIRTRRTVREFKPDPVPDAIVHKILRAGRWAPSSSNTQPWHFIVVRDRETLGAIGRIATQGTFIGQAPLAIAIVMENAGRPQLDAGRALQQMELMAWSEGLGTCFVGLRAAEQQHAIRGQSHAIARAAEGLRRRGNDAEGEAVGQSVARRGRR